MGVIKTQLSGPVKYSRDLLGIFLSIKRDMIQNKLCLYSFCGIMAVRFGNGPYHRVNS